MEERRRFARLPMDLEGYLLSSSHQWPFHLLDVSLKGAQLLLAGPVELAIGEKCRIAFTLSGSGIVITMEGKIVYHEAERLGFHCESIDVESLAHLKRLVEMNIGDQKIFARELALLIQT